MPARYDHARQNASGQVRIKQRLTVRGAAPTVKHFYNRSFSVFAFLSVGFGANRLWLPFCPHHSSHRRPNSWNTADNS